VTKTKSTAAPSPSSLDSSVGTEETTPRVFSAAKLGVSVGGILVMNKGLGVLVGVLLARGLGVEGYGIYVYAFAVMGLLMIVAQWGMPTFLMREVAKANAQKHWARLNGYLIGGGSLVLMLALCVSCISALVLGFWGYTEEPIQRTALYLALILLPLSAALVTQCDILRGLQAITLGQVCNLVVGPLVAFSVILGLFILAPDLLTPLTALLVQIGAVSLALVAATWSIFIRRPGEAQGVPMTTGPLKWLAQSTPFVLIAGAMVLNTRTDVIMIGWLNGPTDVGLYNVAVQGGILISLGLQVVNNAFSPKFARYFVQGDIAQLRKLYRTGQLAAVGAAVLILGLFFLFGEQFLAQIFGAPFADSYGPLLLLGLGYLGNAAFGPIGALATMIGQERLTARILWVTALGNVGLNMMLIPPFGTMGAAAATAMTVFIFHLILYVLVWKRLLK